MKTLEMLFSTLAMPFVIMNIAAGLVAAVWLGILGQWSTILLGVIILVAGAFVVSALLLPGIGLTAVSFIAFNHGNRLMGWLLLLLASPWAYIVIIVWEVAIFAVFAARSTSDNAIPSWLWSYSTATGVWSFMASKEWRGGDSQGAAAAVFGAHVAYIVLSICLLWLRMPLGHGIVVMAVPLLLPLAFSLLVIGVSSRRLQPNLLQVGNTNSIGAVNSMRSPDSSAGTRG